MNKVLHTKYGTARINYYGYYAITTKKEGNYHNLLHKLIFEDFYGFKIPKNYVIHHKDHNKLNNCILNLQMLNIKDHMILHNSGENNYLYKNYARVVKLDNRNGVQRYVIIKNGKKIKSSINPSVLTEWFKEKYPNEYFENKFEYLGWDTNKTYKFK